MLVRSVRCNQETEKAYKIVNFPLQTYPDDLELNNELAISREQSQKWEEAEKALEKVIKLSGDNVQELLPIDLLAQQEGKPKEGPTEKMRVLNSQIFDNQNYMVGNLVSKFSPIKFLLQVIF